jgi:hypothetical protein
MEKRWEVSESNLDGFQQAGAGVQGVTRAKPQRRKGREGSWVRDMPITHIPFFQNKEFHAILKTFAALRVKPLNGEGQACRCKVNSAWQCRV